MNGHAAVRPALSSLSVWLPLALGAAAAATLYGPVILSMAREWAEFPNLSHGFAIPAISGYLVWSRRHELAAVEPRSSVLGLPVLLAGLAMLLVGSLGGEPFVARLSLPLTLSGVVLFLGGGRAFSVLWVSLVYLLFMVPLPYTTLKELTYQSRLFDAGITASALRALGVPVLQDGVMLQLANMTLEVADECSSVPAIAALVALGAAYAQLGDRPRWVRVVLILAAAPLGLLSNIVRLILTSMGAYYLGRIALDNFIHKANGTTVFLATVLLLFALDEALRAFSRRRSA